MPVAAESSVEIFAPIEIVWGVMTDLASYAEWNPFIVRVEAAGAPALGSTMVLHVRWAGGGGARSGEEVTRLQAPVATDGGVRRASFEYRFTGWMSRLGLVRATRVQSLEQAPGAPTRYRTREQFEGWLSRAIPLGKVQAGFELQTAALKARAESLG